MSRYTIHHGTTVLLEPRYCGSIAWYAAMAAGERCMVDYGARFDKRRKLTHRTTIADVNGPLQLTMPLASPVRGEVDRPLTWSDMRLSAHGEWWNVHRVALESAYGRTPFFEFYIDRFLPVLTPGVMDEFATLEAVDRYIDMQVRQLLGLPDDAPQPAGDIIDLRGTEPSAPCCTPYYQIRADRLGFIAGLSILDLLFNLGPEAQLYLYRLINTQPAVIQLGAFHSTE